MKTQPSPSMLLQAIRRALLGVCATSCTLSALAQEASPSSQAGVLQEVIVTARQRAESLQEVPDSVTAFTAATIERAGINDVRAFIDKTPNVFLKQGGRAGASYITVRGITTGQNGWAPVTMVVDGIPTATIEGFNQGTLFDLERIEVLKGPQSALYGAGAIAGAINLITREPTDELSAGVQAIAARGEDYRTNVALSGPLGDKVKVRVAGSFREKDGVYETSDGVGLDRESHRALRARVLGELNSLTIDLRAFLVDSRPGVFMQEMVPTTDPVVLEQRLEAGDSHPERGIIGREQRDIEEFSARLSWQTGLGELALIAGHSEIDQHGIGSASWLKPPAPATFCGPVGGAGQPLDCFQDNLDNVTSTMADLRLTSPSNRGLRWLVGAAYVDRETLNSFFLDELVMGSNGRPVYGNPPEVFGSTHLRNDELYGVYAQLNLDLTPQTELTLAGRYDRNRYDSTQYTDRSLSQVVPTADGVATQQAEDSQFQPKVQLSYRWTDDVMTYLSVARGFRSGFYNSGAQTAPETTTNYELGLKSMLLGGRLSINTALYHIKYSDQQFTFLTPEPPFRASTNIPSTDIDGMELEISARPTSDLLLSAALGVTDARVSDGTEAPSTPKTTLNLSASYDRPVTAAMSWVSRVDLRRQGAYYLERGNRYNISPKNYLNLRTSLQLERWSVGLFVENLLDEQQVNEAIIFPFYSIRLPSLPRTYGLELGFRM